MGKWAETNKTLKAVLLCSAPGTLAFQAFRFKDFIVTATSMLRMSKTALVTSTSAAFLTCKVNSFTVGSKFSLIELS